MRIRRLADLIGGKLVPLRGLYGDLRGLFGGGAATHRVPILDTFGSGGPPNSINECGTLW